MNDIKPIETKPIWYSRTWIASVLGVIISVVSLLNEDVGKILADNASIITGGIFALFGLLRVVTKTAVHFKKEK